MAKVIIGSYDDFQKLLGQEIGKSEWIKIDQARINMFADATMDHQWIHVDQERARRESPFGSTIAHGYLTVSLIPVMWNQTIEVHNLVRQMNYGMDRMKFSQPVLEGQSIRMTTTLTELLNLRGAIKANIKFSIEIKETGKKALEGIATFVYYFSK